MNTEQLSRAEFRAMSKRFMKSGQLDDEMVTIINGNLLTPIELKSFSLMARKKMLVDIPAGDLSRAELNAIYKVTKVRNYYDTKTGRSTTIMLMIITIMIVILNAMSTNEMSIPMIIIFSTLVIGIVFAVSISMNRLMIGRLKREFLKAVAQGYPEIKDDFEF